MPATPPDYQLVADDIRRRIESGRLRPGAWVASYAVMAEAYGVRPHSVKHAVFALQQAGLLIGRQGKGVYVAGLPEGQRPDPAGPPKTWQYPDEPPGEAETSH